MVLFAALPQEIQDTFRSLESEVNWLHGKWIIYCQLYGTSQERIALLNKSASTFFRIIHDVLLDEVVLALTRLTDPDKSVGKDNRSFGQLIEQLDNIGKYSGLVNSLEIKLTKLNAQCAPFREWRNRRIAHSDLLTALSLHPDPLPGISRDSIKQALQIASAFMNEFATFFGENYTAYDQFWMEADGEPLISILEQFWKYREAESKRWEEIAKRSKEQ